VLLKASTLSVKKYFPFVQDLHLYIGLFISPFILIFAVSVLVLNHLGSLNNTSPVKTTMERRLKLHPLPYDTTDLGTGKRISSHLGVVGEIDHVFKGEHSLSIGVVRPGLETHIEVNTLTDSVYIKQDQTGTLRATTYLHKMPGPHLAMFRKNAGFMKLWSILTDMTVYMLLFLTVSGVFLWYFLKVERKMGLYAIGLGIGVFTMLLLLIL